MLSIIISTYNHPAALALILRALDNQDLQDKFEVIIADDGSTKETRALIKQLTNELPYPVQHVWHEDLGFRAAAIRNKAASMAQGKYLIFLDGDCVPRTSFLRYHKKLAESGYFVAGNRILLSKQFTEKVLNEQLPIWNWRFGSWFMARLQGYCNRLITLIYCPLGWMRKLTPKSWKRAKSCNLGIWCNDFVRVNGFNEQFSGWGYED